MQLYLISYEIYRVKTFIFLTSFPLPLKTNQVTIFQRAVDGRNSESIKQRIYFFSL